jgi:hypothetical protein
MVGGNMIDVAWRNALLGLVGVGLLCSCADDGGDGPLGSLALGAGGFGGSGVAPTGGFAGTTNDPPCPTTVMPPLSVSFRQGMSLGGSSGVYAGATDATIAANNPTTNYGASDTCTADGPSMERACLLGWEIPDLNIFLVVEGSLDLYLTDGTTASFAVQMVKPAWTEDDVTWVQATSSTTWNVPGLGSTSDRDPFSRGSVTGGVGFRHIPLAMSGFLWSTEVPSSKLSFIISGSASNGIHIDSSEATNPTHRPTLNLKYCPNN